MGTFENSWCLKNISQGYRWFFSFCVIFLSWRGYFGLFFLFCLEMQMSCFNIKILKPMSKLSSAKYSSCFQSGILPYSFVCACCRIVLLVCFQDCLKPHCILLYSAPLSLRAADVANGNANGGRNNVLSSTVSRPMPHSTSPSPACAAGDQGKESSALSSF